MAFDTPAAAAGQQAEAVIEPFHQIRRREAARAGGGQLDREGDAVEPTADLLYGVTTGVGIEGPIRSGRPLVEELNTGSGCVEGSDGDQLLAGEAETLPRGGKHADVGGVLGDSPGQ